MNRQRELLEKFSKVSIFSGLDPEVLGDILSISVSQRFSKGEMLFLEGQTGDSLYIIEHGVVRVYMSDPTGREKTLAFLGPGDCLGEMAIIDGEPRSANAQAMDDVGTIRVGRSDFRELMGRNPVLVDQFLKQLSKRLRKANEQLRDLALAGARERLCHALEELASRGKPTPEGRRIDFRLTHQQLADLVGTSRETVTRLLLELQDSGVVVVRDRHLVVKCSLTESGRPSSSGVYLPKE